MSDDLASHLPAQSALAHFESYAKIEDERTKALTTPKANVFQRRMYEAYETLLAIMLAVDWAFEIRILGLKIRQCGGTTVSNHIIYHHSQRFATDSVVMTNVNTNSKEVLRRMKIMAQNDAFPWNNPIDPLATNLSWPNGSRSDITSAETTNVGISRTRQAALFSECAKYPRGGVKDDKAIMASILPSLNQLGIAESTPEGASGWMYEQWHGTKDMPGALSLQDFLAEMKRGNKKPGNGWVKVFAAWFEFEENRRHVSDSERETIMRTLTNREVNGINTYQWTPEQIAWRRDKLYSECGGSEELFDEYYPEDEMSCIEGSVRVPTERGLIPISEIVTGDVSNERVVSATRCNGIRETIVVTTQQGFRVVCTPEHRIALENGEWSRAEGTLGRAIRLVPPMFATHPHIVRWNSFGGVQSSLEISEDWGLWLGIYMGDGSFYKNQMSISCDAKDRDSVAKITRLSRRLFGNIFRLRRPKHAKGIELRSYAPAYKQLFQALDLVKPCYHGLKRKIHVPECIWRSPKEVVRQFVRGLFETDGWISASGRTAQLFAKDPEFLRQVQQLLLGFGIQSSLTHRIAKVKGNLYKGGQLYIYNSQIDTFIEEIGFLSARKQARCRLGYKKLPKSGRKRRIIQGVDIVASIASGEKAKVYDLEIQGEPVFAAGGIKVHNCFLSSGRPRFSMGAIVRMERRLHLYNIETGTLNPNPGGMVFIPDTSGYAPIQIWERPRPGCKYLVWCDPATGEDQTESANPDRHSIGVLRAGYSDGTTWHKPKVVARVRPPFTGEGDVVIEHIARLSEFYGKCIVVLEVNMGLHILKGLKDLGVPLFKREVVDPKDREKTLLLYGWKLKDRDQRREVVVCLASHIRDEAIEIPCPHIISEAKTFVIDKNGKETARSGCHDDDILGLGMGLTCIGAATTYHGPHRVKRAPADRHKWRRHPSYNYPRD